MLTGMVASQQEHKAVKFSDSGSDSDYFVDQALLSNVNADISDVDAATQGRIWCTINLIKI